MTAKLSGGISAAGVVVYQDATDPNRFHWLPAGLTLSLGETVDDLSVITWGQDAPFTQSGDPGDPEIVGARLTGDAQIALTGAQDRAVRAAIERTWGARDPALAPLEIRAIQAYPIGGRERFSAGDPAFPGAIPPAPEGFHFSVGDPEPFARFVGRRTAVRPVEVDPEPGIAAVGVAAFEGAPFSARVRADGARLWARLREIGGPRLRFGWIEIDPEYFLTLVCLWIAEGVIEASFHASTFDPDVHPRQLQELGRIVIEALDRQAGSAAGLARFAPDLSPEPSATGSRAWPWVLRVNLGVAADALSVGPAIQIEETVSLGGPVELPIPLTLRAGVRCSRTSGLFSDLGSPSEPCLTAARAAAADRRIDALAAERSAELDRAAAALGDGQLDRAAYLEVVDRLSGFAVATDELTMTQRDLVQVQFQIDNFSLDSFELVTLSMSGLVCRRPLPATIGAGDTGVMFAADKLPGVGGGALAFTYAHRSRVFGDDLGTASFAILDRTNGDSGWDATSGFPGVTRTEQAITNPLTDLQDTVLVTLRIG